MDFERVILDSALRKSERKGYKGSKIYRRVSNQERGREGKSR